MELTERREAKELMRIYIAQILNTTENVLKFLIGFHPAPE
jgi:hypothetical protein